MIAKSTAIVRGTVQKTSVGLRGPIVYTYYQVDVSQQWKGAPASQISFAEPGGNLNGQRQIYVGAPQPAAGQDYVLFLWTSPSGLTQIIGLSQGLFVLIPQAGGDSLMTRAAIAETMLDQNGNPVPGAAFSIKLSEFQTLVNQVLGSQGGH